MKYLDKDVGIAAAGAGLGVIQIVAFDKIVDQTYGPIPGLPPEWAPYNKWSTLGNIAIGGVVTAVSIFVNMDQKLKSLLMGYGVSVLVGGLSLAVLSPPAARSRVRLPIRARGQVHRARSRGQAQRVRSGETPTFIQPGARVLA